MKVLLTGGAGYIGSHVALQLAGAGHEPVLLDNFSNADSRAVGAVDELVGRELALVRADVRDAQALDRVFNAHEIDAVMHFAGLKAAGESVCEPHRYYANNVVGTATLVGRMAAHGVKRLVFSSTAAVYADTAGPCAEDAPTGPATPYGRTKLVAERMLGGLAATDPDWRISVLRYFNAAGAHPGSRLSDGTGGRSNNLLPRIVEVAVGCRARLDIHGDDWPTADGTCVRDYLHVLDVAAAHVRALDRLHRASVYSIHNLGSGTGRSVHEVVRAFERANGVAIPFRVVARRPGDVAYLCADSNRARQELGWQASFGIERICRDALSAWRRCHGAGGGCPADRNGATRSLDGLGRQ